MKNRSGSAEGDIARLGGMETDSGAETPMVVYERTVTRFRRLLSPAH
jgi:hypothetical protein